MKFKTIQDLNSIIKENIYKLANNNIDLIVGVPRSGMLPATIISLYLNLPLTDIDGLLNNKIYNLGNTKVKENWIKSIDEARNILIVEDSSASGNSIKELRDKLNNFKYKDICKILTIYVTEETKYLSDMYFEVCSLPRMFEWNYIHHKGICRACFDIDGVLCEDPTPEENDDGEKYIKFIRNAKLKFAPTFEIGYLVTSRLEKYRNDTEYWLKKNNIKYKKLIMIDLPSKEDRIKLGNHGKFKAEYYKELKDTNIFIESEMNQAIEIAKISGKSVFCTSTSEFIDESKMFKTKNYLKEIASKVLPSKIKNKLKKYNNGGKK